MLDDGTPRSSRRGMLGAIALFMAAGLAVLSFLPIVRCPGCSGPCLVEGYIDGVKIPCPDCGDDRRISPIRKACLLWNRHGR
jgi:hypothetical protein